MGLFSNTKESNFCKSYEEQRKRKKAPTQEEDSVDKVVEEHGEELIGCTVKIWWPIDKAFYEGRITSFYYSAKMHRVLYEDGAHEILDLTEEHWELVEEEDNASLPIQEIVSGPSDLSDSDMPLVCFIRNIRKKKKGKATADPTTPSTMTRLHKLTPNGV
ncbi:sister chromatid cohesion protein PDS5 D isoform X1 [Capsicum chacoense]